MSKFSLQARQAICRSDLLTAVRLLVELTESTQSKYKNEAILHSGDLEQLTTASRMGLLTREEENRDRVRIAHALLLLIDLIEIELTIGGKG